MSCLFISELSHSRDLSPSLKSSSILKGSWRKYWLCLQVLPQIYPDCPQLNSPSYYSNDCYHYSSTATFVFETEEYVRCMVKWNRYLAVLISCFTQELHSSYCCICGKYRHRFWSSKKLGEGGLEGKKWSDSSQNFWSVSKLSWIWGAHYSSL